MSSVEVLHVRVRHVHRGYVETALGLVQRITFEREDGLPMSFAQLWQVFDEVYPGLYGVQLLPPREHYMDQVNRYWIHVLDKKPEGFDLFDPVKEK